MNTDHDSRMTIAKKLWIFSSVLLVSLLGLGAISYSNTKSLSNAVKELAETHLPAVQSMALADMMHDGIRAVVYRADYLSKENDESAKREVSAEIKEFAELIKKHLKSLEQLPIDENSRRAISKAIPAANDYANSGIEIVNLMVSGKLKEGEAKLDDFNQKFTALETELETLGELIESSAQAVSKADIAKANSLSQISLVALFVSFFFGISISFYIIRDLSGVLKRVMTSLSANADQVTVTSGGLEESSINLSSATEQQASALQETAATLEEMTSMVRKTSENSKSLEQTSHQSLSSAEQGKSSVQEMFQSMDDIRDSNSNIMKEITASNNRITEITKVISEIGTKTKVINEIVFQTKLLSFNASVEAARAGEHGKGFAVVAEEVGNLAVMSGNASKEISDMLDNSLSHVKHIVEENKNRVESLIKEGSARIDSGVQTAQTCGKALEDIVYQSDEVSRMVKEITMAINEQSSGISEISKAINMIDQSTQETTSIASKTSLSSSELRKQSEDLNGSVWELSLLIGNATGAAQPIQASSKDSSRKLNFSSWKKDEKKKRAA